MAAKFWFFTDCDRLASQGPGEAFGPTIEAPATKFRVTDFHSALGVATADLARAYAVCDGLLRARMDDEGGLTLILKPTVQPPFDFPAISYFLYKGIHANSLLTGSAPWPLIDVARASDTPLVARIIQDWEDNNNTGDPTRDTLGLHLHPDTPATPGFDPSLYADDKPLDNLFYRGDGRFPARLVYAGERMGYFLANRFGLDVVVGRIGRPPRISLATTCENIKTAPAMPPGSLPANDAAAFMSRRQRDTILDFIDPCAFWGSFFQTGLSAHGATPDKVEGKDVYDKILTGPASAVNFANRNKAYVDVREDHGHSMNYYRETGDAVRLTLDPAAVPAAEGYYGSNDWPSFPVPATSMPALAADAAGVALHLALPAVPNSEPVIYVSVGYTARGKGITALGGVDRFITTPVKPDGFPDPTTLMLPVVHTAGSPQLHSSYHKLHQFRRGAIAGVQTPPPGSIAPFYRQQGDHIFPIPGAEAFPRVVASCVIRTYSDLVYIGSPDGLSRCVARPGIARDRHNLYLFLLPVDLLGQQLPTLDQPVFLPFEENTVTQFRSDLLLHSGTRLLAETVQPTVSGSPIDVHLLYEQAPPVTNTGLSQNFWAIAMSDVEYAAVIFAESLALGETETLSLGAAGPGGAGYAETAATVSYLKTPASGDVAVDRAHAETIETLYRHASV
jgi:hypothetical protein